MFPSFCEGWGLPVSESLAHGKYCVASQATSIPEVGGSLIDYFDPTDGDTAFALIERAIFDDAYRQSKENQIRNGYAPPAWDATVGHIIASFQNLD